MRSSRRSRRRCKQPRRCGRRSCVSAALRGRTARSLCGLGMRYALVFVVFVMKNVILVVHVCARFAAESYACGVGSGFGGLGGECEVSRYMPGNAFTNISNRVVLDLTYTVLLNLLVHDCLGWRSRRSLSGDGMWVMSVGKSRYVSGLGVFPSLLLFCSVVSVLMQMLDCH